MSTYSDNLPGGFYSTIRKEVVTMSAAQKSMYIGDSKVMDTNLIYSRIIGLQASSRDIDIKDFLNHELAPVPTAMFNESGDMRTATAKSTLMANLKVEVMDRQIEKVGTVFIDGSALL